jgi:putative peptide zinc metalloprotease protein
MSTTKHASSASILNIAPILRQDLRFTLQRHADEVCYLIEDEINAKFYRVGIPEYTFISLLDGTTTVHEALALTAGKLGADAFTENDAAAICQWLVSSQLAETSASRETSRITDRAADHQKSSTKQQLNPFVIRLPVWHPDTFVSSAAGLFGWWFSSAGFFIWLFVTGYAMVRLAAHSEAAHAETSQVLATSNLPWLLLTWGLLKGIHELSHAVACKYLGGDVREAGIMLMVFAPIPYVDVTSSWRFESKWHRVIVALAGMYAEIFVASIAAVVWCSDASPLARQIAYNTMLSASVMTVLFNANPLMRFDGYYVLADWLEIPNLYGLGQQYLNFLGRKYALGISAKLPEWGWYRGTVIRVYGILSAVWRVLVSLTILVTTSLLWHGVGIALSLLGAVLWFGVPLVKFVHYLWRGNETERPNLPRFALVASTSSMLMIAISILPEPGGIRVQGMVAYRDKEVVRAPFEGFIRNVAVQAGQDVRPSDTLLELENQEILGECQQLLCSIQMCEVRARKYQDEGDLGAMQAEGAAKESLVRKADDQRKRLEQRVLKAGQGGTVISGNPLELVGTFVKEGTELFAIGDPARKEIRFLVDQRDAPHFRHRAGTPVCVHRMWSAPSTFACELKSISPAATVEPREAALLAAHGGVLPVREIASTDPKNPKKIQLLDPHFEGIAFLTERQSTQLTTGERVVVTLRVSRGNIAQWFCRSVQSWIDARTKAS